MDLNSVKITFTSGEMLKNAINNGIFVHPQHFSLEEFRSSTSFDPVQCFRCQQFHNTVAAFCGNIERCGYCSEGHKSTECPNKDANEKLKCVNCKLNHSSKNRSCRSYIEAKEKKGAKNNNHD